MLFDIRKVDLINVCLYDICQVFPLPQRSTLGIEIYCKATAAQTAASNKRLQSKYTITINIIIITTQAVL